MSTQDCPHVPSMLIIVPGKRGSGVRPFSGTDQAGCGRVLARQATVMSARECPIKPREKILSKRNSRSWLIFEDVTGKKQMKNNPFQYNRQQATDDKLIK